jgi:hypothetical protein
MSTKCVEFDPSLDRKTPEGKKVGLWLHWAGLVGYRGDRVGVRGQVFVILPEEVERMFPGAVKVKDRDEAVKVLMEAGELNDMVHPMAPSHV